MGRINSDQISGFITDGAGDSVEFIVVVVGLSSRFYADLSCLLTEYVAPLPASSDSHVVVQGFCERSPNCSRGTIVLQSNTLFKMIPSLPTFVPIGNFAS